MNVWNRQANEIFLDAVEQPESERRRFLDQACKDDNRLRRQVEAMLAASSRSRDFIEQPAADRPTRRLEGTESSEGRVFEGRYQFKEEIGSGGMGVVYAAVQTAPIVRNVAIKLIKNECDDRSLLARFEQERQALALMDHPNIAKVFEAGATQTGQPYLVMEYIPGVAITDFCRDERASIRERLELFLDVCRGLHHAHQKGVIHRDLKPSNILVSKDEDRSTPKLIDFGVAKVIGRRLTERIIQTGQATLVGTLEYMAPEQATFGGGGDDIDIHCDVYSMGVILYELLTGLRPVDRCRLVDSSLDEAVRIIRHEDAPNLAQRFRANSEQANASEERRSDPKALLAELDGDLNWIVLRCLAKDRDRRYPSANELANDVKRLLSHEPIEARPTSSLYRLRKFVKRRRGLAIAASLVLLSLVGGSVGTSVGFLRAERARKAEAAERAGAELARDRAWDALDAMTSAMTGESLAAQKEVTAEQKRFLRDALASYRVLADGRSNDEKTRRRTAEAARRVGNIENILGDFQRSASTYRSAAEAFESLAQDFPDNGDYRRFHAASLGEAGVASSRAGLTDDEEEYLKQAADEMEVLAASHPNSTEYRSDAAVHLRNLANFYLGAGKNEKAMETLTAARSRLERLINEQPEFDHHRISLAGCHNAFARLYWKRLRDRSSAESHFRKAIDLRESLGPERKNSPATQFSLSVDHNNLGAVLCEMNRIDDGIREMREAHAIQQRLVDQFPSRPDYRHGAAGSKLNLASYLDEKGDKPGVRRLLDEAKDSLERLCSEHPNAAEYSLDLAAAYCNLGIALRDESHLQESIGWFDKAIVRLETPAAGGRFSGQARNFLGNALNGRAVAKERSSQWLAAADDHRRDLALLVRPEEVAEIRLSLAYCLVKGARANEAIAELDRIPAEHRLPAMDEMTRARVDALLAAAVPEKSRFFADRAMTELERSLKNGLKEPWRHLQHESLAGLRSRADFQRLCKGFSNPTATSGKTPKG